MTNQLTYFCPHFCGLKFSMRLAVLGGVLAVPYTRNPLQRGGILFRGLIELGHYCHK